MINSNLLNLNTQIIIIGHKHPDSDSVCSAIACAYLMSKLGFNATPAISGEINFETEFILNRFNVEVPEIITDVQDKKFVLVDHATFSQSIDNIKNSQILGILDHHYGCDIELTNPIICNCQIIGSAATLIYYEFQESKVELTYEIAGLLVSAILSDTMALKAPGTTDLDIKAVEGLLNLAQISDYEKYCELMFETGNPNNRLSIDKLLKYNYKEYSINNTTMSIGVIKSTDSNELIAKEKEMNDYMKTAWGTLNVDICYVMMTNLKSKITKLLCYGDNALSLAQKAFKIKKGDVILKDITARKSQVFPLLYEQIKSGK